MSESFVRTIAERFGLTVLKRVTTGTEKAGFATFELSGPEGRVRDAWAVLKDESRGSGFDRITYPTNKEHPDFGKPYIELASVYFDEGSK